MDWKKVLSRERFARFAWAVLAFNFPVILWGAYVRISYSGDGCGAHWPTCEGMLLPVHMAKPMLIEFTHRMMTSVDAFATIGLCAWALFAFPPKHAVRRFAILSLIFLFIEALLGAGLVIFRYVTTDTSAGRVVYLAAHLSNTMLLLGAYTLTAWLASRNLASIRLTGLPRYLTGAVAVTFLVSITGVVAALGDTLFPAESLAAGVSRDFASASPVLLRLRTLHPFIAVLSAAFLIWVAIRISRNEAESSTVRSASSRLIRLVIFQVALGAFNIFLLAPLVLQLSHLLVADLVWVALVVLGSEVIGAGQLQAVAAERQVPLPSIPSR